MTRVVCGCLYRQCNSSYITDCRWPWRRPTCAIQNDPVMIVKFFWINWASFQLSTWSLLLSWSPGFWIEYSRLNHEVDEVQDESAICERDLLRFYARSRKGSQAYRIVHNMRAKRYSLLPAIGVKGVLAVKVKEGSVKRLDFEKFLKYRLVRFWSCIFHVSMGLAWLSYSQILKLPRMRPYPAPNSVLILDNAQIHHGGRIARLCRNAGEGMADLTGVCWSVDADSYYFWLWAGVMLRYLPPYCPDLNPIETAFSVLKSSFWRTQSLQNARSIVTEMIDRACELFNYRLCKTLYSYAGYEEAGLWCDWYMYTQNECKGQKSWWPSYTNTTCVNALICMSR